MTDQPKPARRWDPIVRITHWSIVAAILANALITEEGSGAHIWVGYALAAILGLRLLWGFVGPAEARFSAFRPSPRKAIAHVQEIREGKVTHHASHNPLGALMVYAIWTCLLTIIATGIAMSGPPSLNGPAPEHERTSAAIAASSQIGGSQIEKGEDDGEAREAGEERDDGEEGPLGEVHEAAANLLYLLILLHIAGVIFETRRSGKQVLLAMAPLQR